MTAVSLWTVEKKGKKKLQTSLPPLFLRRPQRPLPPKPPLLPSSFSVCPSFRPSSVPRDGDGEDGERGALLFLSVGRSVAAAVTDLGLRWLSASHPSLVSLFLSRPADAPSSSSASLSTTTADFADLLSIPARKT